MIFNGCELNGSSLTMTLGFSLFYEGGGSEHSLWYGNRSGGSKERPLRGRQHRNGQALLLRNASQLSGGALLLRNASQLSGGKLCLPQLCLSRTPHMPTDTNADDANQRVDEEVGVAFRGGRRVER